MKRRTALNILGSTTLLGLPSCSRDPKLHRFSAHAFGTEVDFQCHGIDDTTFTNLSAKATARLVEIEKLFSLYREDSAICQINRTGRLENAAPLFLQLLKTSLDLGEQTQGLFDITVQPLWTWRTAWKNASLSQRTVLENTTWQKTLDLIDFRKITIEDSTVTFQKPGMAITLNGIVQGFATEQIKNLLTKAGVKNALINIGEFAALGTAPSGDNWELEIRSRSQNPVPAQSLPSGQALAVSSGSGHTFDPAGRYHHLFHPGKGSNRPPHNTIIVTGPSATQADALSTAYAVASESEAQALTNRFSRFKFQTYS